MFIYTFRRFLIALAVLVSVTIVTFTLLQVSGDPAVALAGAEASDEDIEFVRKQYGFDKPLPVQYLKWAERALHGDLGISVYLKKPVFDIIIDKVPVTVTLAACSLLFALLLAIPLGVAAAMHPNTFIDRIALSLAVVGQALPNFFFALILILVFGVYLRISPISGNSTWQHYILPAVALGYYSTPAIMRLTRAGMLEVLSSDYIRTARAKGLRPFTVLFKHALRNAIIPVVSLTTVQLGLMLSGSIIIESIFSMNGIGRLGWQSIQRGDFEMVQAIVLTVSIFYVVLTFLADVLNAYLDPRIRIH